MVKLRLVCTTVLMKQNLWHEFYPENYLLWTHSVVKIVERRLASKMIEFVLSCFVLTPEAVIVFLIDRQLKDPDVVTERFV